jgi:hypothetical protein
MFAGECELAVSGSVVYVLENAANRVYRFSDGGAFDQVTRDWVVGAFGDNPGEFDAARDLDVHGNRLYVADTGNQRVQALNRSTGAFDFQWVNFSAPGTHSAECVAVGGSTVYVLDGKGLGSFTIR